MKKNLFLVVVLLVMIQTVKAQAFYEKPIKFGLGAVAGIPMSDAKSFYKMAYGFDVLAEYRLAPAFALTADGCYGTFTQKSAADPNMKLLYGLVGLKYFATDIMYAELQGGFSVKQSSGTSTTFMAVPSIGVYITHDIDLSIKYQAQIEKGYNYSYIGIRLGVKIISL